MSFKEVTVNNPLVSIIMSTYNESYAYIKAAVDSLLAQTYSNIEYIIIVDNPENTEAITVLESFKSSDERVKLHVNPENRGLVYCLNYGIQIAHGDYIARMDADDISFPDRIEKEIKFLQANNFDMVSTQMTPIDEGGNILQSEGGPVYKRDHSLEKQMYCENLVVHPSVLIKKSVLLDLQGYRFIQSVEDYDLWLRLLSSGYSIGIMDEPLVSHRISLEGVGRSDRYGQFLGAQYVRYLYRMRKRTGKDFHSEALFETFRRKYHYFNRRAKRNYQKAYQAYCEAKIARNRGDRIAAFKLLGYSFLVSGLRRRHVAVALYYKLRNFLVVSF